MPCPRCAATVTTEQLRRTALGYRTFRCRACRRLCTERTGTPYNYLQYPTDIVLLVVLWRLRYKLSLRDLAEMFLGHCQVKLVPDQTRRESGDVTARSRPDWRSEPWP